MAGYENIRGKGFESEHRSTAELREIQSRGGRKSGEARRRKADFRKTLNLLLTAKIDNPELSPLLEALGLESTLESAINMAMIKKAMSGDVEAFKVVAKYAGQSDQTDADLEEQRIRTDWAKQARNQELGETDSGEMNIQNFLKAVHPSKNDLDVMFEAEEMEVDDNADEKEENAGI